MAGESRLNDAYLSLGSNIDPERNLPAAVRLLSQYGTIRAVSSVWQSPPEGNMDQPDFLNAAVWLETPLTAAQLKEDAIKAAETALGRVRTSDPNAPRTIDIDIMLFNRDILQVGTRNIPDTEIVERAFVAIPLAEIAPDYRHPETGETLQEIAAQFSLDSAGMRRRDDMRLVGS